MSTFAVLSFLNGGLLKYLAKTKVVLLLFYTAVSTVFLYMECTDYCCSQELQWKSISVRVE